MSIELERRFIAGIDVRKADGKTTLVGLAVPYGAKSEDLGFREIIAKGAFSKHLRTDPDVRALIEHDNRAIIGRTRSGTLSLVESDDGIRAEINPPNSHTGNDVVESVRRGDLSAMSFGFRSINDSWTTVAGEPVRTINEAELFDVSIVATPAYPNTTIAVRSLEAWRKENTKMETTVVTPPVVEMPIPKPIPEITIPTERRTAPINTVTDVDTPSEWRNYRTGAEVRVLKPNQRFADLYKSDAPLSLGRAIRAMVVGDWTGAEAEQRALSTTANPTAGILVPNPLAARVIDLARARSVLARAGAQTVDMTASTLTIARVNTDATVEVKAENAAFTGSDVVFDAVELTAYTLGVLVKMSRELAADAPNAVSLIENTIAAKLAERIDFYGLQGTGSAQPLGLLNFGDTNTEAVSAALGYDKILDAIEENELDNHVSNAFILSPANAAVLRKLKVNSETNHYATAPPAIAALNTLITTNCPNATAVVGDFSKFLIGLRQSPVIEVSTEAGAAFENHQVFIKITWRGCFNTERRDAFCLLTSIS